MKKTNKTVKRNGQNMTQKMPIPEFQWKQSICATCEYWGGERELDFQNAGG